MSEIVYHEQNEHERFVKGMPPSPELILEDLPWADPLSDDPEEDRRLTQKQVMAANAALLPAGFGGVPQSAPDALDACTAVVATNSATLTR